MSRGATSLFVHEDLATVLTLTVNGRGVSGSPAADSRISPEAPCVRPARAGVVHNATSRAGEAAIIAAARPVVVKQILELLGQDIPDPRAHGNYLESLSFAELVSRRDQLLREQQEQFEREERNRQPELFDGGAQ